MDPKEFWINQFDVNEGEILGLLGLNGAGKSTTMNIMTGNLSSTEGTVRLNGHEILEEPLQAKKELGYLPETPPLYPEMTVKEYLKFVYRLKKCRLPYEKHIQAYVRQPISRKCMTGSLKICRKDTGRELGSPRR